MVQWLFNSQWTHQGLYSCNFLYQTLTRSLLWGWFTLDSRELCYLLLQSSAASSSTLGMFQFRFEVSVCAKQLMVRTFVLHHDRTGKPLKGRFSRLTAKHCIEHCISVVKHLGSGSAGVSLCTCMHILDFPVVAGFLWSQSHAPFLFSFTFWRRTIASAFRKCLFLVALSFQPYFRRTAGQPARPPWL